MKFSARSLERMEGIDQRLIDIMNLAITITKVDFGIPADGGLRTSERQKQLFREGVSKADGYQNKSHHQTGLAVDVYAYVDGKASWKEEHLSMVACAVLQAASQLGHKLTWGGLFRSFNDMPHFQLG